MLTGNELNIYSNINNMKWNPVCDKYYEEPTS